MATNIKIAPAAYLFLRAMTGCDCRSFSDELRWLSNHNGASTKKRWARDHIDHLYVQTYQGVQQANLSVSLGWRQEHIENLSLIDVRCIRCKWASGRHIPNEKRKRDSNLLKIVVAQGQGM